MGQLLRRLGHDEDCHSDEPPDAWEVETIDILADLLQAPYTFDAYDVGGKRWRDVLTIGDPYHLSCATFENQPLNWFLVRWFGSRLAH